MIGKPKPKSRIEHGTTFAKGGATMMLGKGDRTRTASSDAANVQTAGRTGHKTSGKNLKHAEGGPRTSGTSVSEKAKPGRTAPASTKGR
jgi:hypothetical protein